MAHLTLGTESITLKQGITLYDFESSFFWIQKLTISWQRPGLIMAPHDPGRLHYRKHNIYLNFLETYERIPPAKPITIHQKALFTFWMTCIVTLLVIKIWKLLRRFVRPQTDPNASETTNDVALQDRNKDSTNLKDPQCQVVNNESAKSQSNRPSDEKSSPANVSITDIKVTATARQAGDVEARLAHGIKSAEAKHRILGKMKSLSCAGAEPQKDNPENDRATTFLEALAPQNVMKFCRDMLKSHDKDQPSFEAFLARMSIFGCIMFYFWLTDYLHIWPKVEKQYSRDMFVFLFFLLVFVAAIFSIRTTKDKLLNRDQTEEWKGWMQVQFVWYHYFDAQEVFNSIRVYVGAYVWMTGFGNYIYFSTRKDYSIFRLLKMLFRLNFLVFCVMAVTNHEFVRYYICAMHTYWFLSVWAVMVAFNKYNKYPKFIVLKFVIYFAINALIFNIPGAVFKVFAPLRFLLDVNGKLDYWQYRSWLDHWSTLVGMLIAFSYTHYENFLKYLDKDEPKTRKHREFIRYAFTSVLLLMFLTWFYFVLLKDKQAYLHLHPYTSPLPIAIYTWLRNMHPILRTHYLNVFTWLGKITLETYLSQIHIYMMGDAKKILVYLPQYPMLNFTCSTLIYITVSYFLFHLTVFFSSYLLPRNIQVVTKNFFYGAFWMGACYMFSYFLTKENVWKSDRSGFEVLLWNVSSY